MATIHYYSLLFLQRKNLFVGHYNYAHVYAVIITVQNSSKISLTVF